MGPIDPKTLLRIKDLARQYTEETLEDPNPLDYMAFENAILQGYNLAMEDARGILRSPAR
jgi:hypothetical protein